FFQSSKIFCFIDIFFIEQNDNWNIIRFGHQEISINKTGLQHGLPQRDDQQSLVDISCHQMHKMFSSGTLPEYIIDSGEDFPNYSGSFFLIIDIHLYAISYRHRISKTMSIQPESANKPTNQLFFLYLHHVPDSSRFHNNILLHKNSK